MKSKAIWRAAEPVEYRDRRGRQAPSHGAGEIRPFPHAIPGYYRPRDIGLAHRPDR